MVLEYIEPMCIEAHLEAHVQVLYIPTLLGLEEYKDYSLLHSLLLLVNQMHAQYLRFDLVGQIC